jgi:hypothetical protein
MEMRNVINLHMAMTQQLRMCPVLLGLDSKPLLEIGSLLEKMAENPEIVEKICNNEISKNSHSDEKKARVASAFSYCFDTENSRASSERVHGRIIMNADLSNVSENLGIVKSDFSEDVVYISRKGNKPSLNYNNRLIIKPELRINHIPTKFKNARRIYDFLLYNFKWQTERLREIYSKIGDNQREFIDTLDCMSFNIYDVKKLTEEMLYKDVSTTYRLIAGRNARIVSTEGKYKTVSIKSLLKTSNEIFEIHFRHSLCNAILSEIDSGVVLTDDQLARKIGGKRRTITKYRHKMNIPSAHNRKKIYANRH